MDGAPEKWRKQRSDHRAVFVQVALFSTGPQKEGDFSTCTSSIMCHHMVQVYF